MDTLTDDQLDAICTPYNAVTGQPYKGGNIVRLAMAAVEGNRDPEKGWAGFRQWQTAGRVVRKGERGTACMTVVKVKDKNGRTKTAPRGFRVFHFDQTDPIGQ